MEYMDLLPPTAPSLVFARETCRPYRTELDPVWRFEQRSVLQKCRVVVLEYIINNHLHQNEIDVGGGS